MSRTRVRARRWCLAALVVLAALSLGSVTRSWAAGTETHLGPPRTYVVRPGDTVWEIAVRELGRGADPRPLVEAIEQANRIEPGDLVPGQSLIVPPSA